MSTTGVLRSSSAVPSTSATELSSKRTLSDADSDIDAGSEVPQSKRARSTAPDASTPPTDARDGKKKRQRKKKRKTPVVPTMSASANRPVRERATASVDVKPRSASPVASSSQTRDGEAVLNLVPAPVLVPPQPPPPTRALLELDVIAVQETKVSDPITVDEASEIVPDAPQPSSSLGASSDKGKNKASEQDLPMAPEAIASSVPAVTLDANAELLAKHTALLTTITQSLTCQICLNTLHKPYALAPCGHVACRDCLVAWFSAPAPDAQAEELDRRPLQLRPKRCPHCRALVEARPAEVWVLKEITAALAKSGLAAESMSAPEPAAAADEARDPWEDIFAPPRSRKAEERGVHDDEDGVWRCVDCFHEIWDGVCSGCQRVYPGHHDEDAEDAEQLVDDALVAVLGDAVRQRDRWLDEDGGWAQAPGAWPQGRAGAPQAGYRPWWARGDFSDEENDDDDEDIEVHGPYPGAWGADNWPPFGGVADEADVDDDGDSEDDAWAPRARQPRIIEVSDDEDEAYESDFIDDGDDDHAGGPEIVELVGGSDGEEDQHADHDGPDFVELDSDSDNEITHMTHMPRRRRPIYVDVDDDDDDEVQILDGPPVPVVRRPVLIESDEEGDGDDEHASGLEYATGMHFDDEEEHGGEEQYDAGAYSDEEDEEHDELRVSEDEEDGEDEGIVEDDGSITRIPRHLARQFGQGARF